MGFRHERGFVTIDEWCFVSFLIHTFTLPLKETSRNMIFIRSIVFPSYKLLIRCSQLNRIHSLLIYAVQRSPSDLIIIVTSCPLSFAFTRCLWYWYIPDYRQQSRIISIHVVMIGFCSYKTFWCISIIPELSNSNVWAVSYINDQE